MDSTTANDFVLLFALMLPASVFCWAVIIPAAGFLSDPDDQSIVFRVVARAGFLPAGDAARLVLAGGGLVLFNAAPILYLVRPTPGTPAYIDLIFFLVQGIWLATVVREILISRTRHRDG